MEAGKVPVPIVWPHEGAEVYVTGDFSSYSLTLLTGDKEKYCVVWCSPGTCLYKFMVDGSYTCDKSKPTVLSEGVLYNYTEVPELPATISNLQLLSLEDLEKLDMKLFTDAQQDMETKISKVKEFLLRIIWRKRFLKVKKAVIKIQRWYQTRRLCRRYRKYMDFLRFKEIKCEKKLVDVGVTTESVIEIDLEKERLKEMLVQLTEQHEKLQKSYDSLKMSIDNKKKTVRKVDPPLISIKAFMTPSKPLSFRDPKSNLTPKSKNSMGKSFKK